MFQWWLFEIEFQLCWIWLWKHMWRISQPIIHRIVIFPLKITWISSTRKEVERREILFRQIHVRCSLFEILFISPEKKEIFVAINPNQICHIKEFELCWPALMLIQHTHTHQWSMLIYTFQQLALPKADSWAEKKRRCSQQRHTQTRLCFNNRYWPTPFHFWQAEERCRQEYKWSIKARTNNCSCGWLVRVKWIYVPHDVQDDNRNDRKKRNFMHNQWSGPHQSLKTLLCYGRVQVVHNRIVIIIGSLVVWVIVCIRYQSSFFCFFFAVDLDYNS